ncbi:hypothetical protein [Mycoplasmoides fastidiosum]|uniref:hypothetical protein n=1 Tax=Mycoplasmoides fastidiosum TaxID=92758 RepID=UPI0021146711|nr:hypothetical protein [Mycoplasmoides fastidiosum]UUD37423.1 hypothetical protein NPA10_02490 [Mycoplasmoides fastidiosum]
MFYIKQHKIAFLLYLCLSIITSGIVIFEAYLTYLTYQYIAKNQANEYNILIIVQVVLFLVGLISYIFKTLLENKTYEQIIKNLRTNTIAKISLVKSLEFKINKKGFYISRLINKLDYFFHEDQETFLFELIDLILSEFLFRYWFLSIEKLAWFL